MTVGPQISLAYGFIFFGICITATGIFLMIINDNLISIYLYSYALEYGVNPTYLGFFQVLQTILPLTAFFGLLIGFMVAMGVVRW